MKERSVVHATFVIEKEYPVPSQRVFAAFADPKKKRRWYGEGEESTLEQFDMDFRVGGKERTIRRAKNGWTFVAESVYLDILPNRHIIFAYTMSAGEKRISSSQATVEFLPEAEATKLIFTEQGAFLEGADGPKMREVGWRLLLGQLADELAIQ
jgi:uncharacterized protein YndB with AHSA1/START domain